MAWERTYPSGPGFVVDWQSVDRNSGRQIDWANVPDTYRGAVDYTIVTGGAIATATTVPVTALPVALPAGTILDFEGAGKFALLTAAAALGATSLTVEALPDALTAADEAVYRTPATATNKSISAGTVMCQLSSGLIVPRAVRPGSEDAIGLLETDAAENSRADSLSGYGVIVGGVIYETLLPETITSYKTELAAGGSGFVWAVYGDDTEVSA